MLLTLQSNMEKERITGIILAAGKSSRMGTEKGLLPYESGNFIEKIIETIQPFCDEIIISSNTVHYDYLGFKIVNDNYIEIGPIGGMEACLSASDTDKNLFVTCDSPTIKKQYISSLVSSSDDNYITYLSNKNDVYPLNAVYSKSVLPIIKSQISNNKFRVKDLLNLTSTKKVEISEPLINFNTPDDLKLL